LRFVRRNPAQLAPRAGHAELVQLSSRKVERSDGDSGGRTVTITSYRCDACGTRWNYENDKTNQQAGWSVVEK
jgi:hypothetical protein